jgi:hypothetical protein
MLLPAVKAMDSHRADARRSGDRLVTAPGRPQTPNVIA